MAKIGRNDPCPCGSGKKYKKCCLGREQPPATMPRVMTGSGEEASFHQARYDVIDRQEIIARLDRAPDFDTDEPGPGQSDETKYVWLETGESARLMKTIKGVKPPPNPLLDSAGEDGPLRLLGDIKFKGRKLIFNTMGAQRFALGKKRLESLLEGCIEHRLDSIQSLASAMAQGGRAGLGGSKTPTPASLPDFDPDDPKFAPPASGQSLHDALRSREFENLDELNAFLQIAMDDYNNRPQEALGGLSPAQVRALLDCDWADPECPVLLNDSLALNELNHTPLLHNARLLLELAKGEGGVKATEAGYMDTAIVREVIRRGLWPPRWAHEYRRKAEGRLREMDIRQVHALRMICVFSALLEETRRAFTLTQFGHELLRDEYADALYALLFIVLFQLVDLDRFDREGLSYPEVQDGIAFSLYQLSRLKAGEWHVLAEVAPGLLLPVVKQALTAKEDHTQWNRYQLQGVVRNLGYRLIEPLEICGLIETRDLHTPLLDLSPSTEIKVTELYDRFISFEL